MISNAAATVPIAVIRRRDKITDYHQTLSSSPVELCTKQKQQQRNFIDTLQAYSVALQRRDNQLAA